MCDMTSFCHRSNRVITIAFLTVACGCAPAGSQPPPAVPSPVMAAAAPPASHAAAQEVSDSAMVETEYTVYSAALEKIYASTPTDTFYVRDSTRSYLDIGQNIVLRLLRPMPDVSDDMVDSYVGRNSESLSLLSERFATGRPVVVTGSTRGMLTVTFSRVGFNADMTEAVVHTGRRCGSRCGGGFMMRLSYVDGEWVIRDGAPTFVL